MAIKINGTTVINDSRALSNIASVDATTAASMTAAGVGGSAGWEYVTTINNTGTVSYIDYDFNTTYNHFMIMTSGWRSSETYTYLNNYYIRFKLKTNSSTLYSGWTSFIDGSGSSGYGDPHVNFSNMSVNTATFTNCPSVTLNLYDVKDSTTRTKYRTENGSLHEYAGGANFITSAKKQIQGDFKDAGAFTGVRFYSLDGTILSGTKFKIWGML